MTVDLCPVDPASPEALACMQSYFGELDRTFPTGFDPGPIEPADLAEMRAPQGAFVVAYRNGIAVGCVGLRRDGPNLGEVKRLWVSPDARGAGLAAALMTKIEDSARQLGFHTLRLDTNGTLLAALSFYRSRGWSEIDRYNDNPYAEHFFQKTL